MFYTKKNKTQLKIQKQSVREASTEGMSGWEDCSSQSLFIFVGP